MNNAPSAYVIPGLQVHTVTPDQIINRVCEYYGITSDKILNKGRKELYAKARHVTMYILRTQLQMTYPEIADMFNQADHTTAMYATRRIHGQITAKLDNDFKVDVPVIQKTIH